MSRRTYAFSFDQIHMRDTRRGASERARNRAGTTAFDVHAAYSQLMRGLCIAPFSFDHERNERAYVDDGAPFFDSLQSHPALLYAIRLISNDAGAVAHRQ